MREALEEAEKYSATRVRLAGLNENRATGNWIVASYTHDTSRQLDPQLHTHAVAANLTYDGTEGRWKALQASGLYERRSYLTEVYRNVLAREVRALGYEVETTTPQIVASVVSMREAMEAAFCRAVRVTLVGSITPAFTRSSYCSVEALKPKLGFLFVLDLLDHHGAFGSAVQHDLPHRLLARAAHDGDAELLVALELERLQRDRSSQQRNASARYDAFLDRRASGM